MTKKSQRLWCVTLRHRNIETHIADIPMTHITDDGLKSLMRMIYAKHSLSDEEIVACNLRGNVKQCRPLLKIDVHNSQDPISYMLASGGTWVHAIVLRPGDTHPISGEVMR